MQLNPNVHTLETLDDDLYLLPAGSIHYRIKTFLSRNKPR